MPLQVSTGELHITARASCDSESFFKENLDKERYLFVLIVRFSVATIPKGWKGSHRIPGKQSA